MARSFPLLAAVACGLIPVAAKFSIVSAVPLNKGPCTAVVNGCAPPGPTANGCRSMATYSGSSCEIITLLNVYVCSAGDGDCTLHSDEHCAQLDEYLGNNVCQDGVCVGAFYNITSYYDRKTCAS